MQPGASLGVDADQHTNSLTSDRFGDIFIYLPIRHAIQVAILLALQAAIGNASERRNEVERLCGKVNLQQIIVRRHRRRRRYRIRKRCRIRGSGVGLENGV